MSYSFLDLAHEVLKQSPKPLTYQEVWQAGHDKGLTARLQTVGKTPWQSLGARLYVDVRDNDVSEFVKVGKRPARFFLKKREQELAPDVGPCKKSCVSQQKWVSLATRFLERRLTHGCFITIAGRAARR
jgi:uncharacterized protein